MVMSLALRVLAIPPKEERMPGKDAARLRGKECLCYNIYRLWQGRNLSAA